MKTNIEILLNKNYCEIIKMRKILKLVMLISVVTIVATFNFQNRVTFHINLGAVGEATLNLKKVEFRSEKEDKVNFINYFHTLRFFSCIINSNQ